MSALLLRAQFRVGVFTRDKNTCVVCGQPGQDAHHIMERRLFPDGGYYLDNGATLCGACHIRAEQTLISCEEIRLNAGITRVILPPHLYDDGIYDKWGNPILANGMRMRGELFDDESVQKALAPVLHLFTKYVKYPRTWHFPWSPGVTKDDRIALNPLSLRSENETIIVTGKMDGENTTMYSDYIHARSISSEHHPSQSYVKGFHGSIAHNIPDLWRVCGENLFQVHSIRYEDLAHYFQMFSIWDDGNYCLSWEDTEEWAALLGLTLVPVLYKGPYDEATLKEITNDYVRAGNEGIVARIASRFHYRQFPNAVAKYVRANHVHAHARHWRRGPIIKNGLMQDN